jgi:hypothetical protein
MTGVMAAARASGSEVDDAAATLRTAAGGTRIRPATMSMPMAASLRSMRAVWVLLPLRTPRQLMTVRMARVNVASIQSGMPVPVSSTV